MSESPFRVLASEDGAAGRGGLQQDVESLVTSSPVFLFMKGRPEAPQCGFSANTVAILRALGVEFGSFDVLSSPGIRDAAKEFAKWPTFPQLWLHGELVGGNDIVTEMYQDGELQELLSGAAS